MTPPAEPRSQKAAKTPRLLAWLWGLVLLACILGLAWLLRDGLPVDTRLTAMLPEDHQSPLIEQANAQLGSGFEDRFVLLLSSPTLKTDAQVLAKALSEAGKNENDESDSAPLLSEIDWRDIDLIDGNSDPRQALDSYRYRLLTPELRRIIDQDGGESLVEPALRALFSPAGQPDPVADPFGLLQRWLGARDTSPVQARDGLLTVAVQGRPRALLIGDLASNPYDIGAQQAMTQTLEDFERTHPEATLLRSGLIFHAAAGARQAQREITTIGLGAFIGLVMILLLVFRSPRVLAQMLLPLACGLLFALPLTLALFGRLHLMTLAFGASLIGIAIDYALHLQCDRAVHGRAFRLRRLLPGLTLGLVSSLLAYLAQTLTPMPGLRQMATFAALGLLGAWLSVVLWLPRLRLPSSASTARLAERLWRWTTPPRGLKPGVALIAVLISSALIGWQLTSDDSLHLLNPSPETLLEQERQVQQALGSDTGNRYLLVTAPNEAALLTRLAKLGDTLEGWNDEGVSLKTANLADSVPPPEQQEEDLARVRRLYGQPLETLARRAGLDTRIVERARERLEDVPVLDVATWLDSPLGTAQRRLWLGRPETKSKTVDVQGKRPVAATLLIQSTGKADKDGQAIDLERRLTRLAAQDDNVTYVNRVARIADLLGQLRKNIVWWVTAAVAALTLLLVWRYGRATWRVLTPPMGALLGVLMLFALSGIPLNVFSQLGLLLVMGIGLDAGIFSVEHGRRASTWLAISLSTLTSLLAFGLLAFSATPALHYLGLSCLIGLAMVWCLVPWVRPDPEHAPKRRSL
ncbi:MMPL family transporter [Halomonas sp. GXIMD04776]|uniref:MMPL family transporter n=1 Tax=Halomonas sp. GXIMD04776 TaxID=3415605 RepID=UPI003C972D30